MPTHNVRPVDANGWMIPGPDTKFSRVYILMTLKVPVREIVDVTGWDANTVRQMIWRIKHPETYRKNARRWYAARRDRREDDR